MQVNMSIVSMVSFMKKFAPVPSIKGTFYTPGQDAVCTLNEAERNRPIQVLCATCQVSDDGSHITWSVSYVVICCVIIIIILTVLVSLCAVTSALNLGHSDLHLHRPRDVSSAVDSDVRQSISNINRQSTDERGNEAVEVAGSRFRNWVGHTGHSYSIPFPADHLFSWSSNAKPFSQRLQKKLINVFVVFVNKRHVKCKKAMSNS